MRARFSISSLALFAALLVPPPAHAGNVVSKLSGGKLTLTGDDAVNDLTIDQVGVPADSLRVTPGVGTTVDGNATPQVFAASTGGLKVVLGAEADSLLLQGTMLAGKLEIKAGGGSDDVVIDSTGIAGAVKVDLGVGPNTLTLCSADLQGKLAVKGGFSDPFLPSVVSECPSVPGPFIFGGSFVRLETTVVAGDVTVAGGDGIDLALVRNGGVGGKVKFSGGPGRSFAAMCNVEIAKDVTFDFDESVAGGDFDLVCTYPGGGQAGVHSNANSVVLGGVGLGGKLSVSPGAGGVALCNVTTLKDVTLKVAAGGVTAQADCVAPGGATLSQFTTGLGSPATLLNVNAGGKLDAKFAATPTSVHRLALAFASVTKSLKLGFGAGAGIVSGQTVTTQTLAVKGSAGNDSFTISDATVTKNASIDLGAGNNSVTLAATTVGGGLVVKTGDGNDTIDVAGATVFGKKTIAPGGGTDTVQQ